MLIDREGKNTWWDLVPSVSGARRGTIDLRGREYKIAVADKNWDGLFTPEDAIVFIKDAGEQGDMWLKNPGDAF